MLPRETNGQGEKSGGDQGEWTEVRRKSFNPTPKMVAHSAVTTFFVSNLPSDVNKLKIRRAFEEFGKIVDIYIGGKKDKSGSIFGFVRFAGVSNAKSLERSMCRVRCEHCILKVNIARYQKQVGVSDFTSNRPVMPQRLPTPPPQTLSSHHNAHTPWANKSFADIVANRSHVNPHPPPPPISLKQSPRSINLDDKVLVGESISAQHLASIPNILQLDCNTSGTVYYIGGLKLLIRFTKSGEAAAFYNDASNWSKWFKWLKPGFNDDMQFESFAWVCMLE